MTRKEKRIATEKRINDEAREIALKVFEHYEKALFKLKPKHRKLPENRKPAWDESLGIATTVLEERVQEKPFENHIYKRIASRASELIDEAIKNANNNIPISRSIAHELRKLDKATEESAAI